MIFGDKKFVYPRESLIPFIPENGGHSALDGAFGNSVSASVPTTTNEAVQCISDAYKKKFSLTENTIKEINEIQDKFDVIYSNDLLESVISIDKFSALLDGVSSKLNENGIFAFQYKSHKKMFESLESIKKETKKIFENVFSVAGTTSSPVIFAYNKRSGGNETQEEQEQPKEFVHGQVVNIDDALLGNHKKEGIVVGKMPITGVFYNVRFPDGSISIVDGSSISKRDVEGVQHFEEELNPIALKMLRRSEENNNIEPVKNDDLKQIHYLGDGKMILLKKSNDDYELSVFDSKTGDSQTLEKQKELPKLLNNMVDYYKNNHKIDTKPYSFVTK